MIRLSPPEKLRHQEILTRIGFCNSLVQYTIALAGLVVAGLGGLFAAKDALRNVNFELMIAQFLLGAGLAFEALNVILAQEDRLIRKANRELTIPITMPHPLTDGKFFFVTALGVGFPLFAWWYLKDVRVSQWLLSGTLLVLWVINLILFMMVIGLRVGSWLSWEQLRRKLTGILRRFKMKGSKILKLFSTFSLLLYIFLASSGYPIQLQPLRVLIAVPSPWASVVVERGFYINLPNDLLADVQFIPLEDATIFATALAIQREQPDLIVLPKTFTLDPQLLALLRDLTDRRLMLIDAGLLALAVDGRTIGAELPWDLNFVIAIAEGTFRFEEAFAFLTALA